MKAIALLALSPLLLANQFVASDFEFTAHFVALIERHDLAAAKHMMTSNVLIRSWANYDQPKSFEAFAAYIVSCPIHDIEGVDSKNAHNINVNLDCPSSGGTSLEFSHGRIATISYGGPPIVRTIQAPASNR